MGAQLKGLVPRPAALARKLFQWFKEFAWIVAFLVIALPAISKNLHAQQGRAPIMKNVATRNEVRLDPTLPWMSEYKTPLIYYVWWQEVGDCEGLPVPMDSVRKVQYFQINGPDFMPLDLDVIAYAVTYDEGQTFVAYPYIWNKALVGHEALHLLLKWAGDPFWFMHGPRFETCGLKTYGPPPPNP